MFITLIIIDKEKRLFLMTLLLLIVIISIFFIPETVVERVRYTFIPYSQDVINRARYFGVSFGPSAMARLEGWTEALTKWRQSPFLGYGVTGTHFLDSQYVRTMVELGIIGLGAFILMLSSLYKNTLNIYHSAKDGLFKGLALGFLAGQVGLIFHAITANTYILVRIMEPFWFLAAMVMVIPKVEEGM